MQRFRQIVVAVAIGGGTWLGLGCGDSAGPPNGATRLARVSGDSQSAVIGVTLSSPIRVRVTGSGNVPTPDVTVTWTVTQGSATVGTPSSQTDPLGLASATVTLGNQAERSSIRASVSGLPPVSFTVTACGFPVFAVGSTLAARLTRLDCRLGPFYTDFYDFHVTSGQQGLILDMASDSIDSWLELYTAGGEILAVNDDIDPGQISNSRLHMILAPGDYVIAPSSYDPDTIGPYSLSAVSWPAELVGCGEVWVTRGITVTDSVTPQDCVDASGPFYADVITIVALAGTVLTITHQSTAFDAALFLVDAQGNSIAQNDDSAGVGPNAHLVAIVPETNKYRLFAGTSDTAGTGAYTVTIAVSTTLAQSPSAFGGRAPRPLLDRPRKKAGT